MRKSFRLQIRKEDGPVGRQLLVGLWRGVAIYVGIGLLLGLIVGGLSDQSTSRYFLGRPDVAFELLFWITLWPVMLIALLIGS